MPPIDPDELKLPDLGGNTGGGGQSLPDLSMGSSLPDIADDPPPFASDEELSELADKFDETPDGGEFSFTDQQEPETDNADDNELDDFEWENIEEVESLNEVNEEQEEPDLSAFITSLNNDSDVPSGLNDSEAPADDEDRFVSEMPEVDEEPEGDTEETDEPRPPSRKKTKDEGDEAKPSHSPVRKVIKIAIGAVVGVGLLALAGKLLFSGGGAELSSVEFPDGGLVEIANLEPSENNTVTAKLTNSGEVIAEDIRVTVEVSEKSLGDPSSWFSPKRTGACSLPDEELLTIDIEQSVEATLSCDTDVTDGSSLKGSIEQVWGEEL